MRHKFIQENTQTCIKNINNRIKYLYSYRYVYLYILGLCICITPNILVHTLVGHDTRNDITAGFIIFFFSEINTQRVRVFARPVHKLLKCWAERNDR